MITGYNNDIKHRGTIFHVQTEDKGEASAWIESLIYTGGRILARKRVTYKQLLDDGAAKPAIAKLMERQHRLMIHQIREGRFDGETTDGIEVDAETPSEEDAKIHTTRIQQQAEAMFGPEELALVVGAEPKMASSQPVAEVSELETVPEVEEDGAAEESVAAEAAETEEPQGELEDDELSSSETPAAEMPPPPAPAAPTPVEPSASAPADDDEVDIQVGPAPTLDQVIFDYLSSVAQEESLVLLMDESPALAAGTTTRMDLGTHASRSGMPIAHAVVAVRMISKTGGPVTLAEGATDEEGTLQLVVEVPEVERDSAALIITAVSSIGNAEIKHLL